ncbi:hypothetical protein [Variovorax paradoxus]|uniref:hypothetical protein n=1 Tax=Variovorax paradoxus TaxID=34073 RepID=UPI0012D3E763|nr:hypothetical protein [Variovorax paradoxus]
MKTPGLPNERQLPLLGPAGSPNTAPQPAGRVTTRVAVRLGGDGRSMAGRLMDNLLKDYAGTHYTWDERGNLIERTWNGEKTVFTWDGFNRMRSASTYGKTTHFSYDALGRRIAKRSEHDVACHYVARHGPKNQFRSNPHSYPHEFIKSWLSTRPLRFFNEQKRRGAGAI